MTTQIPAWRDQSSPGSPNGDRATPGTTVGGRYDLRVPIGNGGMGTVWRATDTLLRREVAVKEVILPPTMPRNEQDALCERTMREARAAAALSHPSVVQVYDVVTDGGRPWIVMELLDARSLADMVIDDGPLSQRQVAKIGIAMLGALEVAHAAGVLHRDVKPANVLICADGRCVLTDFGVARLPTESKLTTPGMVLGSPHFISPERAVGGAFGPPSDLFSLGVTLYTAVEGGPPFDRGDPFETMRAVVEEAPRPARLAGPLKPILWGLLDKAPERRWGVEQARTGASRPSWAGGGPHRRPGQTTERREHVGRRRAPTRTSMLIDDLSVRARAVRRAVTAPRNRSRVIVVGGLVTILLVVGVAAWSGAFGGNDGNPPPPQTGASSSPSAGPLIEVQEFRERGIAVNVPIGWARGGANSYVDYADPDSLRWVRINIEPTSTDAMQFLRNAESGLRDPSRCPAPFAEVVLQEVPLGGLGGAELEYTCGDGEAKRHGIWRAVVRDGTVYHFYLTAPEALFADSRIVYDEMVRSFAFV